MTGFCESFFIPPPGFLPRIITLDYYRLQTWYDCLGDSELLAQGGKDGEEAGLSV